MNVKKPFGVLLAAAALLATLSLNAAAQTAGDGARSREAVTSPDISGTWLVNLSVSSGADAADASQRQPVNFFGAKTQAPFIAVETFHADGTFIETSLTDFQQPAGPPGQGLWAKTGTREFALNFYGVTVGDVTNPQLQGTYRVRSKLTLDRTGDQFDGPFLIEIYDPSGALVFTVEGTARGRRALLDPLP